ncbi:MAG: hypothetical protein BWY63_02553 [Chloroflexi bacterium ADurb.Bin360]|nr:MAG: hypothetical protein BWY63_02553 [Chloroflexi bacterium ADurb.Bin360]
MLHSKARLPLIASLSVTAFLLCLFMLGVLVHRVDASPGALQDPKQANRAFSVVTTSEFTPTHWVYLPLTARGQAVQTFGYGIQVNSAGDASANIGHIKTLGFGWMKAQVPWKNVEPNPGDYRWDAWDQLIGAYHAEGIKTLVSIVKAPNWARPSNTNFSVEGPPADPATYASFVGQFSGRYCGKVQAIEVWSEQNIFYEWGGEPLDAARYVSLLRAAYLAIKSACPSISVVSGAPTPTGAGAPVAIDDVVYLQQMYQAGLRNYCDAIGAHPYGYNNPPDARLGYTDPADPSYKNHRSFFFRETLEAYRTVMVSFGDANKRIWPTEFGWPSTIYPEPGYEYAYSNTLAEQAQYSVMAYQMAQAWGWIGPMFLWNLDFGVTEPWSTLAYWSLLRPDPVPAYAALAAMPK